MLFYCRHVRRKCHPGNTIVLARSYAVQSPGAPRLQVFDRYTKWLQRERAASDVHASRNADYLRDEIASRLVDRLLDINRSFGDVLDLGANACNIAKALAMPRTEDEASEANESVFVPISEKVKSLTCVDSSVTTLNRDIDLEFNSKLKIKREVVYDEETLPFESNTFDAVLSSLSIHWINDLPSLLKQVNNILKPDAPFIAAMLGGDSLYELRTSLQLAELDRRGGVSTHTSPLADVRDMGGLLQQAGFKLLTVDVDDIIVDFPDSFTLMQDLQAMGESNAVLARDASAIRRDVLLASDAIYRELHGNEGGRSVPATFRIIYLIGWKEGKNQEKPLDRGSGQVDLRDVLGGGGGFGPGQ